jgi:hypothetical protein
MATTTRKNKECNVCHNLLPLSYYAKVKSILLPDGLMPTCNGCIELLFRRNGEPNAWKIANKLCQMGDVPFIVDKWNEIYKNNKDKSFPLYALIMASREYETVPWDALNQRYLEKNKEGELDDIVPELKQARLDSLKEKWGANYCEEQIVYLENLLQGICNSQSIANDLQMDQALKLCKLSLDMDEQIRAGDTDITKTLNAYNKLIEVSGFSPKNAKNLSDFDSVGELFAYLEKLGWENTYYDGVTRDVVDETLKNIMAGNRRLYVNESGIGDDINQRIAALKNIQQLEKQHLDLVPTTETDLDNYDNAGFNGLEEFDPELK